MALSRKKKAELFLAAADVVRQRGLAHDQYQDAKGCVCTMGALRVAAGLKDPNVFWGSSSVAAQARYSDLVSTLRADLPVEYNEDIVAWNDERNASNTAWKHNKAHAIKLLETAAVRQLEGVRK